MYKMDLELNNLQLLIYNETKPNPVIYIFNIYKDDLALTTNNGWYGIEPNKPN